MVNRTLTSPWQLSKTQKENSDEAHKETGVIKQKTQKTKLEMTNIAYTYLKSTNKLNLYISQSSPNDSAQLPPPRLARFALPSLGANAAPRLRAAAFAAAQRANATMATPREQSGWMVDGWSGPWDVKPWKKQQCIMYMYWYSIM